MSGWVQVYRRDDGLIYLAGSSCNLEGWTVVNGWYMAISDKVPDEQLGTLVQEGLRAGDGVVDISAEESKELLDPLLKEANTKSFAAFAKDALSVGIERDAGGAYAVIPTRNRNRSTGTGFVYVLEKQLTVSPDASVGDIGRAVRDGLDLSIVSEPPRPRK